MFIEKIDLTADLVKIKQDLNFVLSKTEWGVENQIGITHRKNSNNPWKDCTGTLYDRKNKIEIFKESEFTVFNKLVPLYTKELIESLAIKENIKIGRVRYMQLLPKTGLTVHSDQSVRYHLVIDTNNFSYFAQLLSIGPAGILHKIPEDSYFYKIDTTKQHFVYNGGDTPRIHMVICPY
jgi:hypothetical protein